LKKKAGAEGESQVARKNCQGLAGIQVPGIGPLKINSANRTRHGRDYRAMSGRFAPNNVSSRGIARKQSTLRDHNMHATVVETLMPNQSSAPSLAQ
jgi:hypothetical protein